MFKLIFKTGCCAYLILIVCGIVSDYLSPYQTLGIDSLQKYFIGGPFIFLLGAALFVPSVGKLLKDLFASADSESSIFLQNIPGGPIVALLGLLIICFLSFVLVKYASQHKELKRSFILLIALEIAWFFLAILSFPILEISA